jgi:hypothetical protein
MNSPNVNKTANISSTQIDGVTQEKFTTDLHQHIWANLIFAEQKAGFLFVTASGLLVYLHRIGAVTQWLKPTSTWIFADFTAFLACACLAFCCAFVLMTVVPRLGGNPKGIVYWKAIAKAKSGDEFTAKVQLKTPTELNSALLCHCFELAKICEGKFQWLNLAVWAGATGAELALFHLLSLKV